jgi:DNA-binding NarL/FixJ family response regulator
MPSRIYIVEDHRVMRTTLELFVGREDEYEVMGTSDNAEEALDALLPDPPDLAVVDVSLPGMSGIELVRRLRAEHPDQLCLMLSGHAESVYVSNALDAGASGYVMKGDPERIIEAIGVVLDGETYLSDQARRAQAGG